MSFVRGKKYEQLSIQSKLLIIKELQNNKPPSMRSLGRKYDVNESTIRYLWNTKNVYLKRSSSVPDSYKSKRTKLPSPKFQDLEDKLYKWMKVIREVKLPLSPSLTLVKARKIADKLSIPADEFSASWNWLSRFKERRGLKTAVLYGEGGDVDQNDEATLCELRILYDIIAEYDPQNVYNMDETGLFYRLLPQYSILMPDENISTVRGKKKLKDRVTLVVCANATGSHKLPMTIIAKPQTPACIRGREWPVVYFNQKRAWMDFITCKKWFEEVFYLEIKQRTDEPVLLLLDNAPGHINVLSKDNVTVKFLPPNCTSWKQPCDLGIIAAVKKRYKYLYLSEVLEFYQLVESEKTELKEQAKKKLRGTAGVAQGSPANLLDAARIIKSAWDDVAASSIRNSFRKADLGLNLNPGCVEDVGFNKFISDFEDLNIPVTADELREFETADNETSLDFNESILEEIEKALDEAENESTSFSASLQPATPQAIICSPLVASPQASGSFLHPACSQVTSSPLIASPQANGSFLQPVTPQAGRFNGFNNLFRETFKLEEQLACPEVSGEEYDELKRAFENFQRLILKASLGVLESRKEI